MTPGEMRGPHGRNGLSAPVRALAGAVVALVALAAAEAGGIAALPGRTEPARWVADTTTAVELTVALVGLVVFAAVVPLVARRPRRRHDEPPRIVILPTTSRPMQLLFLLVAISLIVAPFVLLIATPGHQAGTGQPRVRTTPAEPTATAPSSQSSPPRKGGHPGRDATVLALSAAAAAASAFAFALARRGNQTPHDAFLEDEVRADVAAAASAASSALGQIDSDPRSAVIAAYSAMTSALSGASTQLRATETPRRLLERAAAAGVVDPKPTRTLILLFEHARFSTHPVTAAHVSAASQALEEVQASLTDEAGHR